MDFHISTSNYFKNRHQNLQKQQTQADATHRFAKMITFAIALMY